MPLQMIKNFSIKSGKSEAEVEKLWDKLKIEYKNDYPKIVGTLKKILNINEAEEGTYVARKVLNADSLYKHYKDQGVDVVPAEELHCTIAFSRKTFTPKLNDDVIEIKYDEEIHPYLEPLGDEGAVVMKFNNKQIIERCQDCIDRGATYDYPQYQPHITITFNGKDLDLKNIKRPDFYIELGDEYTEPLNLNWKEKINNLNDKKEKDMDILETLNSSKLMFIKSQMIKESIDDLTEDLVSKYLDLYEEHKISILESDKFLDLVENLEFDKLTEDEIDRLVEKCSEYSDEDDDDDDEEKEINESIKTSIMVLKDGKLGESISNLKETMYLMLGENQDFQGLISKDIINESVKLSDVEDLLGKGTAHGKYTKFTLKDGTYVLFHPTIGLEYRAKDDSLLPHNWKTVKAMKKELTMAGMLKESLDENLPNPPKGNDLKKINDLVAKIKSKYNYKNFEVNYKDGQIYGGTSGLGFNNKGYDYKEVIEKLERILKYGEELFESELDENYIEKLC